MKKVDIFIVALVLVLLIGSLFLFSLDTNGTENTVPSDYVRIESLRFCGVVSLSEDLQRISICGSVVADKPSIPIRMYLYEMPSKTLVAQNQVDERFLTGDFVREFDVPDSDNSASYKIVAYFYKNVIGELEFAVRNP